MAGRSGDGNLTTLGISKNYWGKHTFLHHEKRSVKADENIGHGVSLASTPIRKAMSLIVFFSFLLPTPFPKDPCKMLTKRWDMGTV